MKYNTWLLICVIVLAYLTLNYWNHAANLLLRLETGKEGLPSLQAMCKAAQTDINALTWSSLALGSLTCALFLAPKRKTKKPNKGVQGTRHKVPGPLTPDVGLTKYEPI